MFQKSVLVLAKQPCVAIYVLNISRSTLNNEPDTVVVFVLLLDRLDVGGGEASPQCFFSSTARQPLREALVEVNVELLAVGVPGPVPDPDPDADSLRLCLLRESDLRPQVAQLL